MKLLNKHKNHQHHHQQQRQQPLANSRPFTFHQGGISFISKYLTFTSPTFESYYAYIIAHILTLTHIYLICGNLRVSVLHLILNCLAFTTKKCLKIHFEKCWCCWSLLSLLSRFDVCVCVLEFLVKTTMFACMSALTLEGAINAVYCAVHCV